MEVIDGLGRIIKLTRGGGGEAFLIGPFDLGEYGAIISSYLDYPEERCMAHAARWT